jgi:chromosome segregation ATPase
LFEQTCGKIEFEIGSDYITQKKNLFTILTCLENYFTEKSWTEKFRSPKKLKIRENILIKDLFKPNTNKSLIEFGEIILLLTSVSSEKDLYIDRISECEEVHLNFFLDVVEKYMILTEGSSNKFTKRTSLLMNFNDSTKTFQAIDKINKKNDELENCRKNFMKTIEHLESEIETLNTEKKGLEDKLEEKELRIKDMTREMEMFKNSNQEFMKVHNETFKEFLKIDNLKKIINDQEIEIDRLKKEHRNEVRTHLEKITQLEEVCEDIQIFKEKYNLIYEENEKYKTKSKDGERLKNDNEKLEEKCNVLENNMKTLLLEKIAMKEEIQNLSNDILIEKDLNRKLQYDIENLNLTNENLVNQVEKLKITPSNKKKSFNYNLCEIKEESNKVTTKPDETPRKSLAQIEDMENKYDLLSHRSNYENLNLENLKNTLGLDEKSNNEIKNEK